MEQRKIKHKAPTRGQQEAIAEHISDIEYAPSITMHSHERFSDRELTWLDFNSRVLQLAEDSHIPLLERISFSAIFASNLDEFFKVRVAGLKRRIKAGMAVSGASGMPPSEVLEKVLERARLLQQKHALNFIDVLRPLLSLNNIRIQAWDDLEGTEQEMLEDYFTKHIFPILTPLAVDSAHPFPYISGGSLSLAILVQNPKTGAEHFARLKIPSNINRFIKVEALGAQNTYITLEDLISKNLAMLFPGMDIKEVSAFRVTRNEDVEVEEDDAENLLKALEKELLRRRFGPPIRLEVQSSVSDQLVELLISELGLEDAEVISVPGMLDHTGLFEIASIDRPDLHYPHFMPKTHRFLSNKQSSEPVDIFSAINKGDILLHHPYDSFSTSVQRFLEQAAGDPKVLAIKQTLYRTSGDSPIIDALIDAALSGKQVLALVEIKARFDEEANISWARKLEKAGVHVVYGIAGLKTHCKLALVVRNEDGVIKRYSHIGTGNYNPKTARIYTDHGLLTDCDQVGEDLTKLFNQLSGYAPKSNYHRLLVAPKSIRKGIISRIHNERKAAEEGKEAWIKIKINSIVDEECIDALYRAAEAGVKIDLIVRGICTLKTDIPSLKGNIRVRSILGRFLEHSRIFAFCNQLESQDESTKNAPAEDYPHEVLIGSADLMHRNLDRRVETLVKIVRKDQRAELINLLEYSMSEDVSAWDMGPEGVYERNFLNSDGEPLIDIQQRIIDRSRKAVGTVKLK
jgi:polyphosphate kinase